LLIYIIDIFVPTLLYCGGMWVYCPRNRKNRMLPIDLPTMCESLALSASDSTCTQYCRRSALYKLLCMYVGTSNYAHRLTVASITWYKQRMNQAIVSY